MNTAPTNDVVQEFKVELNNYSPEYGRGMGVVNIVTKSGTNTLHGSVFEYHQDAALIAGEFFRNSRNIKKPAYIRNQFGAAVGGPVRIPKLYNGTDRTWFFAAMEQLRQSSPLDIFSRVPTTLERAGDFSKNYAANGTPITIFNPFDTFTGVDGRVKRRPFANNQIPANLINPFAKTITQFWPGPTRPGGELGVGGVPTEQGNFLSAATSVTHYTRVNLRLDHQIGTKHRLFGRFSKDYEFYPFKHVLGNIAESGRVGNGGYTNANTLSDSWSVSSNFLIEQSLWFNRSPGYFSVVSAGYDPTQLGGPFKDGKIVAYSKQYGGGLMFPHITVGGYYDLGQDPQVTGIGATNSGGYKIVLTKTHGPHSLRWGFDYQIHAQNFILQQDGNTGAYTFGGSFTNGPDPLLPSNYTGNGYADFLLGVPNGGSINSNHWYTTMSKYFAWYLNDTWRVTPKLTLSLGARYDFELTGTERHDRMVVFDANVDNPVGNQIGPNTKGMTLNQFLGRTLKGGYIFAGSKEANGQHRLVPTDFSNLAPRVGFAYQVNPKLVIRGGAAKMYALPLATAASFASPSQNPFTATTPVIGTIDGINPYTTIDNPFPGGICIPRGASLGLLTNNGFSLAGGAGRVVVPYSFQYNFGFEYALPGNSLISVSYGHSQGRRLQCPFFFCGDQLSKETLAQGPTLLNTVPNPFYGIITDPSSALSRPTVQARVLQAGFPQFGGERLCGFLQYRASEISGNSTRSFRSRATGMRWWLGLRSACRMGSNCWSPILIRRTSPMQTRSTRVRPVQQWGSRICGSRTWRNPCLLPTSRNG